MATKRTSLGPAIARPAPPSAARAETVLISSFSWLRAFWMPSNVAGRASR